MPLLVNSVPNLAQGVSQQPDNLRFPGQCDEQINAWATVVEGLVKRPPTTYTKKLLDTKLTTQDPNTEENNLFTHFVKRSEQNQYCVTVSLGNVSLGIAAGVGVTMVDGTNVPVAVTSIANSYLSLGGQASLGGVANPLADLRALTVADYTFLVNKNRVIEKSTDAFQKSSTPRGRSDYVSYNGVVYICIESHTSTSSFDATKWEEVEDTTTSKLWTSNQNYTAGLHEALIAVKLGDYEKSYNVYIDDQVVNFDSSIPYIAGLSHTNDHIPDGGTTAGTYKSGTSQNGGIHADTTRIAKDLKHLIEGHVTNTTGISSLSLNPNPRLPSLWGTATSGLDGKEYVGLGFFLHYRMFCEISQPGSTGSTALLGLEVIDGVIDGWFFIRRGSGFNPTGAALQQTFILETGSTWENEKDIKWRGKQREVDNTIFDTTNALSTTNNDFDVTVQGSLIKLSNRSPFKLRVEDGLADQGMGVIYREVNSITELPAKCYNNFIVKVIGDADIDQDDYYVRFSTKEKEDFGEGSWVETVGYYQEGSTGSLITGIDTAIKNDTMPVTLVPFFNGNEIKDFRLQTPNELLIVKQGSTYYRLDKEHSATNDNKPGVGTNWEKFWTEYTDITQGYLEWKLGVYYYGPTVTNNKSGWGARAAGDDFTNPFPSFVGKTIRDIFFFKNRLGILTDSNIIFSEADEYFNFFRTTTQQLLDSAVIDVGLSHTKVAILEHAVPFQEKLMLFSQGSQFVLRGADVLSPKTVAISPATEYDLSDGIQPVALGNYIYFPFKRNDFEGVYEYFVDNNTETFNAEEITQQVPKYITSDVQKIVGSQAENTIVMSTTADARRCLCISTSGQIKKRYKVLG